MDEYEMHQERLRGSARGVRTDCEDCGRRGGSNGRRGTGGGGGRRGSRGGRMQVLRRGEAVERKEL